VIYDTKYFQKKSGTWLCIFCIKQSAVSLFFDKIRKLMMEKIKKNKNTQLFPSFSLGYLILGLIFCYFSSVSRQSKTLFKIYTHIFVPLTAFGYQIYYPSFPFYIRHIPIFPIFLLLCFFNSWKAEAIKLG
jgi:Na+-transporting NADH:ubiquinone oxidoreductase subunit NqrB